jgi:hypothetical protein
VDFRAKLRVNILLPPHVKSENILIDSLAQDPFAASPFCLVMEGQVLRISMEGTLTRRHLKEFGEALLEAECAMPVTPDRITDLTRVTRMEIEFSDIWALVQRRRASPPANPIKSAIVAASPVQLGYARMFQTLNDVAGITVSIFSDEEAAMEWIEAD